MRYLLAVHVPIAGLALIPVALGWPLLLFPAHIVFLEMIIDPVSSIVFEAEPADPEAIDHPPRPLEEPLFRGWDFAQALLRGGFVLVAVLSLAVALQALGRDSDSARSAVFAALVFGNLALLMASRSEDAPLWRTLQRRNRAFWLITAATVAALALVCTWPPATRLFQFGPPVPLDLLLSLGVGFAVLGATELAKAARRHKFMARPPV